MFVKIKSQSKIISKQPVEDSSLPQSDSLACHYIGRRLALVWEMVNRPGRRYHLHKIPGAVIQVKETFMERWNQEAITRAVGYPAGRHTMTL